MQTGQLTIGTMILNETNIVQDSVGSDGARTLSVAGVETSCEGPVDPLKSNIMGLLGKMMPVKFQYKTTYDGYYVISNANVDYEKWFQGSTAVGWNLTLVRLGPDNSVDLESRVANVVRSNNFSQTGERWHAPAGGHTTYYIGAVSPTKITRVSADGALSVYRSVPASINPLWSCPVTGYANGRSRFIKDGIERLAERFETDISNWELNNGLVRVKPYTGGGTSTFFLAVYDGTAWRERAWDLQLSTETIVPTSHFRGVTVLRNDPECVIMRIVAIRPSNGNRVLIDITLRRGSRFLEFYIQRATSGDITIALDVNDPATWTDQGGYAAAAGPDQDGLTWAAGTSKTFTVVSTGGITKTSVTAWDFWVGAVVPNPSAGGSNPDFETGVLSPWFATNGTGTVVNDGTAKFGTYFGRLTATGGFSDARLDMSQSATFGTAGRNYTISGWLRSPIALAAGDARFGGHWYNGGAFISSWNTAAPALSAGVWTPVSFTATAPASTTNIGRQVTLANTPAAGKVLDVDHLYIREATQSGDLATDMQQQYIAVMTEKVGAVRR